MMRPRVTATFNQEAVVTQSMYGDEHTSPAVELVVEFDLHDHAAALHVLESCVQQVRAQIEETTRGGESG